MRSQLGFQSQMCFGTIVEVSLPYHEQHIFNYRLSRARRTVENAFGIMANRFRVLLTKIMLEPKKAAMVVLAICCLHNMLIEEQCSYSTAIDTENQSHEGSNGNWHWNISLSGLQKTKSRNFFH